MFTLIGLDGLKNELELKSTSTSIKLDGVYYALEVKQSDALSWLEVNGDDIELDGTSTLLLPIIWDKDFIVTIITWFNAIEYTIKFYFDEKLIIDKKLQIAYSDFRTRVNRYLSEKSSINDVVNLVNNGSLPLLSIINPDTEIKANSLIKLIDEKLQFAFNICSRPRMHLKNEIELLDIERVKRINEQSLQHLASHSEHWKARTLSGIIPGRMNAEVFDDEYDIYENIFFRMAIEKISEFISNERQKVERALRQNESLIDWESYANQFSDYKRVELMYQLLPDYDSEAEGAKYLEYTEVLDLLKSIEKRILGIRWSGNYQKISRSKVLSRPIIPTNILNMDKNYHEIYMLWNHLGDNPINNVAIGIEGDVVQQAHESYFDFVAICTIYALNTLAYQIEGCQEIRYYKGVNLKISVSNEQFFIDLNNANSPTQHQVIEAVFTEKLNTKVDLPQGISCNDLPEYTGSSYCIDGETNRIVFYRKPIGDERKDLSNIFKNLMNETEGKEYKINKNLDKIWRQYLSDHLTSMPEPRKYKILISPLIMHLGDDEVDFRKLSDVILEQYNEGDSVYFVAPYDLYGKDIYEDKDLIDRSLSYGELPFKKFGSYSRGLLPISQIEVNSVTRILKIFEMTATRLAIEWKKDKDICPVCGSKYINHIDENTSKCMNNECGTIWGLTHCTGQCGKFYAWTRPDLSIASKECNQMSYQQLKSKKESWFGSRTITEFYLDTSGEHVVFKPRCPYCG